MIGAVRVGILSKTLGRGGAEMLMLEQLSEGLITKRCSYRVGYLSSQDSSLKEEISQLGVPVTAVARNELDLLTSPKFRRWVSEVDIIHVHSPLPAGVLRALSRLPLLRWPPFVYTEHGMWDAYRPIVRMVNRATFRLWSENFVVSLKAQDSMGARARPSAEILHHGVAPIERPSPSARTQLRAELGIPPESLALVNVANATPAKRHELLVDLASQVVEFGHSVWHIGGGPELGAITSYAEQQRSPLRFLGPRTDVRRILPAFDGSFSPPEREGLPVAVMEAIAAGLPVATTDCGGVTELVEHEVNGLVSPVGDLQGLVTNCGILLQPETLQRLAPGIADAAKTVDRRAFVDTLEQRYLALHQANPNRKRRTA